MARLMKSSPHSIVATILLATLALAACQSGSRRLASLYEELGHEVAAADPIKGPGPEIAEHNVRRADAVRELLAGDSVNTAEEHFKAAVLLVETTRQDDLELAEHHALVSAEMGEKRGLRVAAEAVDKRLMLTGKPQKYGTQFVFEWVLDSWRLYPCDVTTSDGERAQLGVPTYAELMRAEDDMNRTHGKKLRPH